MRVSLSRCERVSALAGGLDAALTRTLTRYSVLTRRNFHSPNRDTRYFAGKLWPTL